MGASLTRRQLIGGAAAVTLASSARVRADDRPPLRVGMSTALTGPASALGLGMKQGIEAYFALANAQGGVWGRPLTLIAKDDAYEPPRAAANVRKLIAEDHVFAILGNAGTPTAAVTVPIVNALRVPFFGAFTGADLLRRTPPDRYVVNFRASYAQETAFIVQGLARDLGVPPERFAFVTQEDAYGDAGFTGAAAALRSLGFEGAARLPHGRYSRNTVDVEDALATVLDPRAAPKAVILVGAYAPCARFIALARRYGLEAVFANVSFVGSEALARELGVAGDGVVVTQVVPHVTSSLPAVVEYRAALGDAAPGFVSLEGFLAAKAFVAALRVAGAEADQEGFVDAIESGYPFDLGLGMTHSLSPARHQWSDGVWLTRLRHGRVEPLKSWTDLRRP